MKKYEKIGSLFIKIILILTLLNVIHLSAQVGRVIFDNKGTDFWLAFLPNFHNNIDNMDTRVKFGDSLYIFIVADTLTTGTITYHDRYGFEYTKNFSITNINQVYTFKLSFYDFETWGYNRSGRILSAQDGENFCEKVSYASFHIKSDNEVTVYAHSQANTTSDAFMVLPTDVLGEQYYVLSYKSDGTGTGGGNSTPSQFLIVAAEDSTDITIIPSTETYRYGKSTQRITLNQGEVYLVQALIDASGLNRDLTGTKIVSNKPVAVFSGHQRSTVPIDKSLTSRDCLIEQMLPLKTWGENALLAPYPTPSNATKKGNDLFRVLFSADNTDLYINNNFVGKFDAGEFYESPLKEAVYIQATDPILVAGYKKTSKDDDIFNIDSDSDPFMMIIPPIEQYLDEYLVTNIQAWEFNNSWVDTYEGVYSLHYITIIAHKDDLDSIFIDNIIVNSNLFKKFPGVDYYYANIRVNEGSHRIKSSGKIGVYIYGYGYANSYGYTGGLSLIEYDFKEPEIYAIDSCYKFFGMAYDTSRGDSKLQEVNFRNVINLKTNIFNNPNRDSLSFSAELVNKYDDGYAEVYAIDSVNQESSMSIGIPGFTISLDNIGSKDSVIKISGDYRVKSKYCYQYQLKNYGNFDHLITGLNWNNVNQISLNLDVPFVLKSKNELLFELCVFSDSMMKVNDTITIYDDCGFRDLVILDLNFVSDTLPPTIDIKSDSCNTVFNYFIADTNSFDWGIKEVKILDTLNCEISIVEVTYNTYNLKIEVINPYKDAIISLMAVDSLDQITIVNDTLQGFTIDFPQFIDKSNELNFGKRKISFNVCDSIIMRNYGILPFTIENIFVKDNIKFSIPQYQFPMIILPNEELPIIVCYHPDEADKVNFDTLIITKNCIDKEIQLIGIGDTITHRGEADCGVDLIAVARKAELFYKLGEIYPNPASDELKIPIYLNEPSDIALSIFNLLWIKIDEIVLTNVNKGWNDINIDLSEYSAGNYLIIVNYKGKFARIPFIKN